MLARLLTLLAVRGPAMEVHALLAFTEVRLYIQDLRDKLIDTWNHLVAAFRLAEHATAAAAQREAELQRAHEDKNQLRVQMEELEKRNNSLGAIVAQQDKDITSLKADARVRGRDNEVDQRVAEEKVRLRARGARRARAPPARARLTAPPRHRSPRRQIRSRDARLESDKETVAAAVTSRRLDKDSVAFFETLMTAEPPPAQKHLRLLIVSQLATLRNKSGKCAALHNGSSPAPFFSLFFLLLCGHFPKQSAPGPLCGYGVLLRRLECCVCNM